MADPASLAHAMALPPPCSTNELVQYLTVSMAMKLLTYKLLEENKSTGTEHPELSY